MSFNATLNQQAYDRSFFLHVVSVTGGRRMTGSACQAMDVVLTCDSLLRGRSLRRENAENLCWAEAGGLPQNAIYIYIYSKNQFFGRSKKERFLDRFSMIF